MLGLFVVLFLHFTLIKKTILDEVSSFDFAVVKQKLSALPVKAVLEFFFQTKLEKKKLKYNKKKKRY